MNTRNNIQTLFFSVACIGGIEKHQITSKKIKHTRMTNVFSVLFQVCNYPRDKRVGEIGDA